MMTTYAAAITAFFGFCALARRGAICRAVRWKTKTSQLDRQRMNYSLRARPGDGFLLKF
jgi:hypothetical protein